MSFFPNTITSGSIGVATGGTGNTSTTAYAVQAGGTTSTGKFQAISGIGSSGQVLTSNGANLLPSWQNAAGGVTTATSPLVVAGSNVALGTAVAATTTDSNADVNVGLSATTKKFVIQGKQGQTANVLEFQSYDGTVQNAISLGSNIIGSGSTMMGVNAGKSLQSGSNTTCFGYGAGSLIVKNLDNTCIGFNAGLNVTGAGNSIVGSRAGDGVTTGATNVIVGVDAGGASGGTGQADTVQIGYNAGLVNTANNIVFIGSSAGAANTSSAAVTYIGYQAGKATTGNNNTFVGSSAGSNTTAAVTDNTLIGYNAGTTCAGSRNTVAGSSPSASLTSDNVLVGYQAGLNLTGNQTVIIGSQAGATTTTPPDGVIFIGYLSGGGTGSGTLGSRSICIGASSGGSALAGSTTLATDNTLIGDTVAGNTLAKGSYNSLFGSASTVASGSTTQSCVFGWNSKGETGSTILGANRLSTTANDLIVESADCGIRRVATAVLKPTDGNGNIAWIQTAGLSRVSSQYNNTGTTLGNVTGLTATVIAARSYFFEAELFVDADATDGSKYAIAGTATATAIVYQINLTDNTLNTNTITSRQTALAGSAGQAGTAAGICRINGLITVNAAGTLTVQFAKNTAINGNNSSVLVGSYFNVWDCP